MVNANVLITMATIVPADIFEELAREAIPTDPLEAPDNVKML